MRYLTGTRRSSGGDSGEDIIHKNYILNKQRVENIYKNHNHLRELFSHLGFTAIIWVVVQSLNAFEITQLDSKIVAGLALTALSLKQIVSHKLRKTAYERLKRQ